MALQLLRPIDALLLPPGQTRPAEVLSSNARGSQFDLVLRLMQTSEAPAREVAATSPRPLTSGTQLLIQAVSQTQLMAILQPAASTAAREPLTKLDPAQFPAGTRVQLEVISQQQLQLRSKDVQFAVLAKLLQGPAAGALLSLNSSKSIPPGTLVSAQVGVQGELRVPDPGRQQLVMTLVQGLRETLQRQGPAEPLLSGLERLSQQSATREGNLPTNLTPSLDKAVRQVLQQVANLPQLTSAKGVEQAILRSGSFLEPNLLKLSNMLKTDTTVVANQSTQVEGRAERSVAPPVVGASLPALSKLIAALSAQPVGADTPALPGADLKASLINLLLQLQQQLPGATLKAMGLAPGPWQQGHAIVPSGAFPLPARAMQVLTEAPDLGALLRLTAALLSRIQHHQLQSLGQSQTFSDGTTQTTWQLEIPLRDGQQFSHVQVRIQRDETPAKGGKQEQTPHWEVRLAFNLDQLGALQAIARLYKGRVSTEFWAEQAHTLALLDTELTQLRDRLLAKGLEVGELSCHRGTPPQPNRPVQQSWIDEVT